MSILFIEKINHRFKRMTNTRQASGLSVCINQIMGALPSSNKAEVDTIDHVDLAIQRYRPKKVVVEALWMSEEECKILRRKFPKIRFYVHVHSNVPFLVAEGMAFHRLVEMDRVGFKIIFNSYSASSAWSGSLFLPNVYEVPFLDVLDKGHSSDLNIICGGSVREMKNQAIQALAAIKYADLKGKKLSFHMNMGRSEGGSNVQSSIKAIFHKYPKHTLVNVPWSEHKGFIEYLRDMDLGMQVSMTESFNLVTADYLAAGLPVVVSREIDWCGEWSKCDIGNIDQMVSLIDLNINDKSTIHLNRKLLKEYSENSVTKWRQFDEA